MVQPTHQGLKYGVIYIYFDPEVKAAFGSYQAAGVIGKIAHPFKIEWVPEHGRGHDNTLLVARRFNVGNMGQYATVSLRTSDDNRHGVQFDALKKFRDLLFKIEDGDDGDIMLDEDDFGYADYWDADTGIAGEASMPDPPEPQAAPQDKTRVESRHRGLWRRMKKNLNELITTDKHQMVLGSEDEVLDRVQQERDLLEEDEKKELAAIERERRQELESIRRQIVNYIALYHQDPTELMEELLKGKVIVGQPGRVLVNGDLKIVLPEYDEMEIKMPAMSRTLYILFMKLRKQGMGGIVLRNIDQYRDDLIDIYSMVKPGASEERVIQTIDNLCDPFSESLNQKISRANRCIKNVITDKELAKRYTIRGTKGGKYGIALEPEYMELPRAITA